MDRKKHLDEILEKEECEIREKSAGLFDDEYLDILGIKAKEYRNLIKNYSEIFFKETREESVYIPIEDETIEDKSIMYLYFDDETIERGKNIMIKFDRKEYEENPNLKRTFFHRNNYVAIEADDDEYIFISKVTKEIFMYFLDFKKSTWNWIKLANNFDEFIDNLYCIEN